MPRPAPPPLPDFSPERFADRLAEAVEISTRPEKFDEFPRWTQKVMLILRDQLVPPEYVAMLSADRAIFCEGVCVAWVAHARDIIQQPETREGKFATKVAQRLTDSAAAPRDVYAQVGTGAIAASEEFRAHVMGRLFATNAGERRAFTEGLAAGNRVRELFDRQAARNTTDATGIYLLLWLYWPEINALRSVGEAAHLLERLFGANRNLAGRHWEERFRKLANRIGLSFRAKQKRRRIGR
ncbi:MAG: hypothetical protein HZA93_03165 [Verrucomicrobia bacterium]|nr:hypothetical protein [Verrucomicrobiota bacterium]